MSESAVLGAEPDSSPARAPLEQRLFIASPLGTFLTAVSIFAILFAAYLGVSALYGLDLVQRTATGVSFRYGAWPAFVLSVLCAVVLGMQRYARMADGRDRAQFAAILIGGRMSAERATELAPRAARLGWATAAGLVLGGLLSLLIFYGQGEQAGGARPLVFVWFWLTVSLLAALFARGVEMTRHAARNQAKLMHEELKIDLLRIDNLNVLGRSATRPALIWLATSAVTCLFFLNGAMDWFTLALLGSCTAMGLWIFVMSMLRVHQRIVLAKAAELEHVRCEIEMARARLNSDADAAVRIQGLLAYEARIAAVREWAFDQPTAMRVAIYLLIPATAWLGQAVAQYFVEHAIRV